MLNNIGPIGVSRKLFRNRQASPDAQAGRLHVWDFDYNWHLSPRAAVGSSDRGALIIAHSLGGLLTLHAVNARPEVFSGVLHAGVPHQCMDIHEPLRNGDAVLFNEKLLTARVNFSIRTSFALLPEDSFCFVDKHTGEPYPVDLLDPMSLVRHGLSPCLKTPLPPLSGKTFLLTPDSVAQTRKTRMLLATIQVMLTLSVCVSSLEMLFAAMITTIQYEHFGNSAIT
ncbi:phosphatidylcholine-sterol O-acyltransferase-like protein [Beauveria brongniartii RCEF 3172]|uniref:Phosphatidylcholine-sterol O-acyltransferase-like protein n=1 Tax=Beauveria brongniartii RCEF 3172 TaxID=1081107 RepID=A0A167JU35_9HYPO|nr:phosphatidylcholine-sterol O-acyltransferase-like protein [Beauveria brongniartii RCEF 3172]